MTMQSTFVRLDDADLAATAKRLTVIMTDEGAHAWYKHDVAELLQELVAMRQERTHAIESFREHAALSDVPDNLPAIAAAWRESVTGLWEKAQVKKLRAEIAQGKQEISDLTADLRVTEHNVEDLKEDRANLQAQLVRAKEDRDVLSDELVKANNTILDLEQACIALQAQHVSTIRAYDLKLEEMRNQRTAHVERIEELESQVSTLMDEQATEQQRIAERVKAVEDAYMDHALKAKHLLLEAQTVLGA